MHKNIQLRDQAGRGREFLIRPFMARAMGDGSS